MTSDDLTNEPGLDGELGSADADIRSAYSDLSARASNPAVAARATMPGRAQANRSERGSRFLPPLVVAGVLAAAVGGGAMLFAGGDDQQVETGPAETNQIDDSASDGDSDDSADGNTGDGEPSTTEPDDTDSGTDSTQPTETNEPTAAGTAGSRYRVAMELVAADSNDPFLNMRTAPGADSDLLAKLPANYAGLEATGNSVEVPDGGTWMEFTLLDTVPFNTDDPFEGLAPVGWANASYVEFLSSGLPIGADELAPCSGDGSFLGEGAGSASVAAAQGQANWYVYAMESGYVTDQCLRVVMTFGQGQAPIGGWFDVADGVGPASGTPSMYVSSSGGFGVSVELPGISSAAPQATETDDSVFLVRQPDGSIDLEMLLPTRGDSLTAFVDQGIVVLDINVDAGSNDWLPPSNGRSVHLVRDPILFDDGAVELVGIARPFEANLGVRVVDDEGSPVEAVFSGSRTWGTQRTSSYSVTVDDWIEAWGQFAIRVEGLAPGDYTIELEDDSGSDDAQPFRLPVTITAQNQALSVASDEDQSAALQLLRFAEWGDVGSLPLADEVTLLLGAGEERQVRSSSELENRQAWTFDAEDGLGGLSGPFNAIDTLSSLVGVKISAGPIDHCAGPPREWPAELDGLRQVSIEPVGIDSCIAWSGVSLFLNGDGDIEAVVLDAWGP